MADITSINVAETAKSALNTVSETTVYIVVLLALGGLLLLLVWWMSFRHRVIIKRVTSNGIILMQDRAKTVKVDGYDAWKFRKMNYVTSVPPKESLKMNNKGKLVAECYFSEDLGVVWAGDLITEKTFNEKVKVEMNRNGKPVGVMREVHQPFGTVQRAMLANQIRKAIERKGTSGWEKFQQIIPWLVPVFILIIMLLFWEDIAKPAQQISELNVKVSEQNAIISEQNARILTILYGPNANITVRQVIPPNAGGGT